MSVALVGMFVFVTDNIASGRILCMHYTCV